MTHQNGDGQSTIQSPLRFSAKQLAALFGCAQRSIARFAADEGMPVADPGRGGRPSRYDAADCVRWYIEREVRLRGGSAAKLNPLEQRALLDEKRREELDLRIRLRRGELIETAEAKQDLTNVARATQARLRRIPDAAAEKLVTAAKRNGAGAVRTLLLAEIDDALRELAAHAETLTETEDDVA